MSRALPKYNKRRVGIIGGAAAVALSGAIIAGSALAGETSKNNTSAQALTKAAAATVNCPAVANKLPAIPASAKAEVDRNLALLNTQIAEANKRIVDTQGQGGANFVQNAILGPLKDKRVSTINRIATAIGRTAAKPVGLDALAACGLNGGAAAAQQPQQGGNNVDAGKAGNNGNAGNAIAEANKRLVDTVGQGGANFVQNAIVGPLKDKRVATINRIATAIGRTAAKPVGLDALAACSVNGAAAAAPQAQQGGNNGNAANTGNAGNAANAGNAGGNNGVGTISCPDVASQLPAIPASAQAEVDRNLALLNTQIAEANKRLVDTVGQGGANFVQNAIVGPL
ncbi:hypothetical protein, partial [Streptomyces sp. NRRL WC-3618]|uniref:hypothetical protein n=1 Tax=Streptomyces sp. NRRL WC-3618 TaxID=1519490 RepID=UPI000A7B6C27